MILKFSYGGVGDEGLRACGSGERLKAGAHRSELVPPEDGMPSRDLASAECPGAVDVGPARGREQTQHQACTPGYK